MTFHRKNCQASIEHRCEPLSWAITQCYGKAVYLSKAFDYGPYMSHLEVYHPREFFQMSHLITMSRRLDDLGDMREMLRAKNDECVRLNALLARKTDVIRLPIAQNEFTQATTEEIAAYKYGGTRTCTYYLIDATKTRLFRCVNMCPEGEEYCLPHKELVVNKQADAQKLATAEVVVEEPKPITRHIEAKELFDSIKPSEETAMPPCLTPLTMLTLTGRRNTTQGQNERKSFGHGLLNRRGPRGRKPRPEQATGATTTTATSAETAAPVGLLATPTSIAGAPKAVEKPITILAKPVAKPTADGKTYCQVVATGKKETTTEVALPPLDLTAPPEVGVGKDWADE